MKVSLKWAIYDWACNLLFSGKEFKDYASGEKFLSKFLDDTYEELRQEYYILEKGN